MEFKNLGMNHPGMWRFRENPEQCCIYRVPNRLRRVNPKAYTPQFVIIGPLHHSLRFQACKSPKVITDTQSMDYLNMEEHKKIYLAEFAKRVGRERIADGFRRMIKEDEGRIRESYSESTAWIESPDFVEMILHDSVFILEFILRFRERILPNKIGDPLMDEFYYGNTVMEDLILLENQLPYFILEKLFDPIVPRLCNKTFREVIISYFGFKDKIGNNSNFQHFTDMLRCVRVETLPTLPSERFEAIELMYNAAKLRSGGVKFEALEKEHSLHVSFESGCLKIPSLRIDDSLEIILRNVMALEQCHYPTEAYVCDYILFLDYLIDTDKDVDLLLEKGIIQNWIGGQTLVADMVNKLSFGIVIVGSYNSHIAEAINNYYQDPINKKCAILKRVYFSDLWTGTATIAATFL